MNKFRTGPFFALLIVKSGCYWCEASLIIIILPKQSYIDESKFRLGIVELNIDSVETEDTDSSEHKSLSQDAYCSRRKGVRALLATTYGTADVCILPIGP